MDDKTKDGGAYRVRADRELNKKINEFIKAFDADDNAERAGYAAPRSGLPETTKLEYAALMIDANGSRDNSEQYAHLGHRARLRAAARRDIRLDGFRDVEVLEMVLSYLIPRHDTAPLAKQLIARYGSLTEVLRAPAAELIEFPLLNGRAVMLLPAIAELSLMRADKPVFIKTHIDAADYFGSLMLGSTIKGTFAVCIGADGRMLGIEKCDDGEVVSIASVLGATVKHNTRHVVLIRRERNALPNAFDAVRRAGKLMRILKEIGIFMADFLLFTDYGYYTLGAPSDDGYYPQYIFVPVKSYSSAPELIDRIAAGGKLPSEERVEYASAINADDPLGDDPHVLKGIMDRLRR